MERLKIRKIVWRKDTFGQKIVRSFPALGIRPNEVIKDIKILNNSVVLDVVPKEEKKKRY